MIRSIGPIIVLDYPLTNGQTRVVRYHRFGTDWLVAKAVVEWDRYYKLTSEYVAELAIEAICRQASPPPKPKRKGLLEFWKEVVTAGVEMFCDSGK